VKVLAVISGIVIVLVLIALFGSKSMPRASRVPERGGN
jgi:hypothetical protein